MTMSRYKSGGWFNDSHRHFLAAKYGSAGKKYLAHGNHGGWNYYDIQQECMPQLKHGKDPDSQFDPEQLAKGVQVEMEHTNNPVIAKQIAKAHLKELPDYYTRLETIEQTPAGKQMTVQGVPIEAEKVEKGRIYPVKPEDVAKEIQRQSPEDIKGLKGFKFVNPVGEQKDAWGQYVRSKKVVYVFSQPYRNGKIDGQDPKKIREHIKEYVLPHEIGHHVALRNGKTDKDLRVAEARADAHVVGMDPTDKDVKKLVRK